MINLIEFVINLIEILIDWIEILIVVLIGLKLWSIWLIFFIDCIEMLINLIEILINLICVCKREIEIYQNNTIFHLQLDKFVKFHCIDVHMDQEDSYMDLLYISNFHKFFICIFLFQDIFLRMGCALSILAIIRTITKYTLIEREYIYVNHFF